MFLLGISQLPNLRQRVFLQFKFTNYIGLKICEPVLLLPSGINLLSCKQMWLSYA